jgi:hypothetical protein
VKEWLARCIMKSLQRPTSERHRSVEATRTRASQPFADAAIPSGAGRYPRTCRRRRGRTSPHRPLQSGNPAVVGPRSLRPVTLRPRLSPGLPCIRPLFMTNAL